MDADKYVCAHCNVAVHKINSHCINCGLGLSLKVKTPSCKFCSRPIAAGDYPCNEPGGPYHFDCYKLKKKYDQAEKSDEKKEKIQFACRYCRVVSSTINATCPHCGCVAHYDYIKEIKPSMVYEKHPFSTLKDADTMLQEEAGKNFQEVLKKMSSQEIKFYTPAQHTVLLIPEDAMSEGDRKRVEATGIIVVRMKARYENGQILRYPETIVVKHES